MSDEVELKKCPFCGKEVKVFDWGTGANGKHTYAQCVNKDCFMSEDDGVRIITWNRRPLEDALQSENANLKELIGELVENCEKLELEYSPELDRHETSCMKLAGSLTGEDLNCTCGYDEKYILNTELIEKAKEMIAASVKQPLPEPPESEEK